MSAIGSTSAAVSARASHARLVLAIAPVVVTAILIALDSADAIGHGWRSLVDHAASNIGDPWPTVQAASTIAADHGAALYRNFTPLGSSFIYPPLAAVPFLPLAHASYEGAHAALSVVSRVAYAACLAIACALAWADGRRVAALLFTAICAVGFYPLLRAVELNQSTLIVSVLVGASLLASARGRDAAAGALFALTAAFKPQLALVVPLLYWRSPRFTVAGFASLVGLALASLAFAGLDNHLSYLRVIGQLSGGYSFYPNQSWSALFMRLSGAPAYDFAIATPAPAVRALSILASLATLAGGAWLLYVGARRRGQEGDLVLTIGLAWLVVTLVSPVSWEHHYLPAIFVFARFVRLGAVVPMRALALASCAFPLIAGYVEVRGLTGPLGHLAMSYVMAGGLLLAFAAAAVLACARARDGEASPA
jgi:hypothetical protein